MKRILLLLLAFGLVAFTTPSFADQGAKSAKSCPVCDGTTSKNWGEKTGCQLARGIANTGLCWVELVNQPMKEVKGGGNVLVGIGKGVGHTLIRLGQGVGEILTAPFPNAKDGSQIAKDCPMGVMGMTDR